MSFQKILSLILYKLAQSQDIRGQALNSQFKQVEQNRSGENRKEDAGFSVPSLNLENHLPLR